MGVPFFFSWLLNRYPMIQKEYLDKNIPNIDYLYMDLNGVIHNCVKEEKTVFKDLVKTRKFHEIWAQIFNYINKIIDNVVPKKLIFMALDGVAPRAKMNQQRTRRFKSSRGYLELNKALHDFGVLERGETFNGNSISPGTEFMHELGKALKFFALKKMEEDIRFRNVCWVISGTDVPGEGEHKILDYMRGLKSYPEFDADSTHCIYGADADLIMLGLSIGIKNICILREVIPPPVRVNNACRRYINTVQFQILYLNILREYMESEYRPLEEKMKNLIFDINRIIDDFILLCFFIGNDFLPRMYCFDIREGNFENLLNEFKDFLCYSDSYIQNNGVINWPKLLILLEKIAKYELQFIGDRLEEKVSIHRKSKFSDDICDDHEEPEVDVQAEMEKTFNVDIQNIPQDENPESKSKAVPSKYLEKEKDNFLSKDVDFMDKLIQLCRQDHIEGKKFYYEHKLKLDFDNFEHLKKLNNLLLKYTEGLQFVLYYYYSGCPDWDWYFPEYYSPLISDLVMFLKQGVPSLADFKVNFKKSVPFSPFKQLLLIMPPESSTLLPMPYHRLFSEKDSILRTPIDLYPNEFEIDQNGAVYESEYVAILPFVPDELLEMAYSSVELKELSEEERQRNKLGKNTQIRFNRNSQAKEYPSYIEEYYDKFWLSVEEFTFEIEDLKEKKYPFLFTKDETKPPLAFPSLSLIRNKNFRLLSYKSNPRRKPTKRMEITLQGDINFNEMKDKLLNKKVCFNYPDQREGVIIGIITKDAVQTNKSSYFMEECQRNYPNPKALFASLAERADSEHKKKVF